MEQSGVDRLAADVALHRLHDIRARLLPGGGGLHVKLGVRAELSTAIELYRAMAMTFWLPQAEVALAQVEER